MRIFLETILVIIYIITTIIVIFIGLFFKEKTRHWFYIKHDDFYTFIFNKLKF